MLYSSTRLNTSTKFRAPWLFLKKVTLSNFPLYSDGESANFTTLCNLSICNPSLKETIKNHNHQKISKKRFFTQNVKTAKAIATKFRNC
ncbi:hypothetical protein T11_414 [Trichinella zimbabwensis]|uniref:Uncharacterized protein n=1 Tax=Trichinella zimbabwensis TaxID=268475 RepID=A0A0V1H2W2_9BILA|nr:hypothetical protein T11_414 [Trichinella zimbabwensis]